jgi:hypothetical protein
MRGDMAACGAVKSWGVNGERVDVRKGVADKVSEKVQGRRVL